MGSAPGVALPCGFPTSLTDLQPVAPGVAASNTAADLIDNVLAGGTKSGYTFTYLQPGGVDGNGCGLDYTINGEPANPGTSGQRYFYTDQTGVIRANPAASAAQTDPPIS